MKFFLIIKKYNLKLVECDNKQRKSTQSWMNSFDLMIVIVSVLRSLNLK